MDRRCFEGDQKRIGELADFVARDHGGDAGQRQRGRGVDAQKLSRERGATGSHGHGACRWGPADRPHSARAPTGERGLPCEPAISLRLAAPKSPFHSPVIPGRALARARNPDTSTVVMDSGFAAMRRPGMMVWTAPRRHHRCQAGGVDSQQQRGPSMTKVSMIGLDLAKNVFQAHGVDAAGKVVVRASAAAPVQVEKFLAALPPRCGGWHGGCSGAHHWGRVVQKLGNEARIMPAGYVKPYVKRNKNDGRDAEGVCEAMGRPTMRFVRVEEP